MIDPLQVIPRDTFRPNRTRSRSRRDRHDHAADGGALVGCGAHRVVGSRRRRRQQRLRWSCPTPEVMHFRVQFEVPPMIPMHSDALGGQAGVRCRISDRAR